MIVSPVLIFGFGPLPALGVPGAAVSLVTASTLRLLALTGYLTTRRDEVRDWDSLAYISFMVGVETEFGVKFGVAEIESFDSVGSIVRRMTSLLASK